MKLICQEVAIKLFEVNLGTRTDWQNVCGFFSQEKAQACQDKAFSNKTFRQKKNKKCVWNKADWQQVMQLHTRNVQTYEPWKYMMKD